MIEFLIRGLLIAGLVAAVGWALFWLLERYVKGWRTVALGIVTAVGSTAGALLEWAHTVDWERYFKDGDLWWVPVGLGALIIIYRIGTGTAVGEG
jgi:hypothetical protein